MTSCPTCSSPLEREHVGKGEHERAVNYCPRCVSVWPVERHLQAVPTDRKDLQ